MSTAAIQLLKGKIDELICLSPGEKLHTINQHDNEHCAGQPRQASEHVGEFSLGTISDIVRDPYGHCVQDEAPAMGDEVPVNIKKLDYPALERRHEREAMPIGKNCAERSQADRSEERR